MKIPCFIKHSFVPQKAFYTYVTTSKGERYTRCHIVGLECEKCGKRKLAYNEFDYTCPSPGERQEAYDWVNAKLKKPVSYLTLVK